MPTKMRFEQIPPDYIKRNKENPRQAFDEERLDQLAESIREKGVLVPITVYEKAKNNYILLDGERRLRAAKRINLLKIPAWVTSHPNPIENLEAMFHIHMERDEWSRIDALRALKKLIEKSGVTKPVDLQKMTGIPEHHIIELQRILAQPAEYQKLIMEAKLPFIFFTELHTRIIEPLSASRPGLFKKFNEAAITRLFIKRRKTGALENMTQVFRQVNAIIRRAAEVGTNQKSPDDKTLERVFSDPDYPIEEAYEDATGATLESQKFVRHCDRFRMRLAAFVGQDLSAKEKKTLRRSLKPLAADIREALRLVQS